MKSFFKIIFMNQKIQAFTLLEVLASLAIVTMVILGPLSSAINSASYSRQTKDTMVATYLAEEALETLRYQSNTMYINCTNTVGACDPRNALETPGEQAWRLFKQRLAGIDPANTDGISCFSSNGCSYDFLDMSTTTNTTSFIYSPIGSECSTLAFVTSSWPSLDPPLRTYYICNGSSHVARLNGTILSHAKTAYSRYVTVVSVPTFEITPPVSGTPNLGLYYDDLIITAFVSYRKSNGIKKTIKVTDFLHARS
jgi:type II secretory pathway pseudopilin PulG